MPVGTFASEGKLDRVRERVRRRGRVGISNVAPDSTIQKRDRLTCVASYRLCEAAYLNHFLHICVTGL